MEMATEINSETLTLILVNLAGIMETADDALLPGVYKEVGEDLCTDPAGLGLLTSFGSIVKSFCYPLAAYLALRHNRAHVIALGAFLWAAATFLVAVSSNFAQFAVSRGLNGIGLAIVIPAAQSLVADSTDDSNRGTAFGWLHLTGYLGSIIGGNLAVLISSSSHMGIAGWRIAFHIVAFLSVVVGILVRLFAKDPRFIDRNGTAIEQAPREPFQSEVKDLIKEAKAVIRIPSFQILIAQGISGSFPSSSLSFAPMLLELIGFSHKTTAFLWTLYLVARSIGGLFGGKMGDVLAKRFPNAGRIILSQISSGFGIPLAAILLLALPYDPSTAVTHGLVLFIMGLITPWNAPGTNNPIFAEIVPERSRTIIYALDRSFESILASFAPYIVGILSQHVYGYERTESPEIETDSGCPAAHIKAPSPTRSTDRENAAALSKALYIVIGVTMAISWFIYSFLYCTYPRDRDRARMDALIEAEMQQIETDRPSTKEYSRLHVVGSDELQLQESSVFDMDYEGDESTEFDEQDKKWLLSHHALGDMSKS